MGEPFRRVGVGEYGGIEPDRCITAVHRTAEGPTSLAVEEVVRQYFPTIQTMVSAGPDVNVVLESLGGGIEPPDVLEDLTARQSRVHPLLGSWAKRSRIATEASNTECHTQTCVCNWTESSVSDVDDHWPAGPRMTFYVAHCAL